MSKDDLKVKPVDQEMANEDLKKINGRSIFICASADETKETCSSRD